MNYITTTKGPPNTRCVTEETPEPENRVSKIFTEFTRQQPEPNQ